MELNKKLLELIIQDPVRSRQHIMATFNLNEQEARQYKFVADNMEAIGELFETDKELIEQSVKYKKQQQKSQDISRIERKSFREHARIENALSELTKELIQVIKDNPYKVEGTAHAQSDHCFGVIQISDTHFNELINLVTNKYDFTIASRRIYKLVAEARKYLKLHGVTDVFLFFTGDLMNSDRRLDEKLAMATNRSKAIFISVQILEHAIFDLNKDFNLHIAGVVGNESRVSMDYHWLNDIISDNYDYVIFNVLRYKLKDTDGINFLGMSDKHEEVVEVGSKHFLLIHGHQIGKDVTKDVSKLIRKYANMNIKVDFVIWGHLHETMISDMYARSASLCGSNSYSEGALLLIGKASQNVYLVFDVERIDSIKIDLQDTEGYEGYNTEDWEDSYNPKSLDKVTKHETVLRITI